MPTTDRQPALRLLADHIRYRLRTASNLSLGLAVFFVLLVLYVATGNIDRDLQSPDAVAAALPAWHFVNAHNLYLDKVPIPNIWVYAPKHHLVSNRQPGVVFFGVPFYWLLGRTAVFSMFPAVVAAATASAGAVALLTVTMRSYVGTRLAVIAAVVVGLGTATWSVSADTLWPHGPDQLFLAAAMFFLSRSKLIPASLAIALCVPIRAHLAVFALIAGVWFAIRRRSGWPLLIFGLPSAISIAGLLTYDHWLFGSWSLNGGYPSYVTSNLEGLGQGVNRAQLPVNILGSLFSLDRGLVIWCPVLVVLAFGLRAAWRNAEDWVRISAVAGLFYFLIQMKLNYFSGGDRFWSYRLTIETLTLTVPLFTLAASELRNRRPIFSRLALACAIYGIGAQAVGAIYFKPDFISHSAWTHSKLAQELVSGGNGPRVVMALTVVLMLAALFWPRRPPRGVTTPAISVAPQVAFAE